MAGRKFFSGLPDGMMAKNLQRPNRQVTNFYWPDESEVESNSFKTAARNRLRSRCTSSASLMSQSQASSDTEESRRRKLQQNDSKIEFYDYTDATDTESVVSSRDRNRKKKIETLSSRIAFYDFMDPNENQNIDDDVQSVIERPQKVKTDAQKSENPQVKNEQKIISNLEKSVDIENLAKDIDNMEIKSSAKKTPYKYVDSFSDDSDDNSRYFRDNGSSIRGLLDERRHLPPRHPSTQRFMQRRPRPREYYDYDDEIDRNYSYENSRRSSMHPQSNRVNRHYGGDFYSQEISDEEYYFQNPRQQQYGMPRQHGNYFEENGNHHARHNSRMSLNRRPSVNGLADMEKSQVEDIPKTKSIAKVEVERQSTLSADRRSPAKTLKRTESVNEARQRYFTNLKSNIFHNNAEYSEIIEKKPLSVRDFAANARVGVGLPDIDF